ncbi:hairy-related 3 [Denticeps clupeoides]|uniref:hairy-related 3 n=1 Tax=Denticeps clupeoides TaxID=299321 RepID=UPI0010A46616|nr:transcription factor HES-3 [Denticeps clupeoides]
MAAAADLSARVKLFGSKKASKPLMEKKRRARINKCLDQLKSLLESCYSNQIRKRKLEKADILELTVKHLLHLHRNQNGPSVTSDLADYQAGFRSCLAGVHHFLLAADADRTRGSGVLTRLTRLRAAGSSTADSDPSLERGAPRRSPPSHMEASSPKSPSAGHWRPW